MNKGGACELSGPRDELDARFAPAPINTCPEDPIHDYLALALKLPDDQVPPGGGVYV